MKRLLIIGLVLGVVGIVMGGLFVVGDDVMSPDRPGQDAPSAYLHVLEVVNNSEDVDGSVIEYANLTPEQQTVFEKAVTDDNQFAELPDDTNQGVWYDTSAVSYDNKTYRVAVSES
jgi:hypothetical protein